jgi:5-formyltetrahydrofolate cyclo-ligase
MTIAEEKSAARGAAKSRRDAAHARLAATAPRALLRNFIAHVTPAPGAVVAGYWPGRSEIDIRPLLVHLAEAGHEIALPVVTERGSPLLFRRWRPGDALERKSFGLFEPPPSAAEAVPQLLLVPFLAVDAMGYRIGYGAGYYDRTLAKLRAMGPVLALGVGYEAQRVERLPHDGHDEPLDRLVTETGAVSFARDATKQGETERESERAR